MIQDRITVTQVHSAIQEMNKSLSSGRDPDTTVAIANGIYADPSINVAAIAKDLNMRPDALLAHIEALALLQYIQFADKKKENIKLTFSGKNTIVPL